MKRKSLTHGFTLIELLVVISIISLLISILLPALGSARKAAVKAQCASNYRQTGIVYMAYVQDFKGYVPPSNSEGRKVITSTGSPYSFGLFQPYLQSAELGGLSNGKLYSLRTPIHCPASEATVVGTGGYGDWMTMYNLRYFYAVVRLDDFKGKGNMALATGWFAGSPWGSPLIGVSSHQKTGDNTLFADGHVRWMSNDYIYERAVYAWAHTGSTNGRIQYIFRRP